MMDLINQFAFLEDLPPFIQDIILNLILLIGAVLVTLLLRQVLTAILLRLMRLLARRTRTELDDMLLDAILSPARIAIMGLALMITVSLLGLDGGIRQIAETLARILMIVALFYAAIKAFRLASRHPDVFKRITGLSIPERLLPFLNVLVNYLIIALGAIFVLQELRVDVTALIASLGVIGIGISLASQNTVANFFGFAAIVTDNPFKVGDFIKTPDVTGIVEAVGLRATRIRQLDQGLVTVPNNALTDAIVLNWSRLEKRRLDVTLTLTYSTTSAQMRTLLDDIRQLLQHTDDIDSESVIVHFVDFSASSLDVRVICQVLLTDFREFTALKEKLYLEIMDMIERRGLQFAFPSQSIYIENPDAVEQAAEEQTTLPALDEWPQEDSEEIRNDDETE